MLCKHFYYNRTLAFRQAFLFAQEYDFPIDFLAKFCCNGDIDASILYILVILLLVSFG